MLKLPLNAELVELMSAYKTCSLELEPKIDRFDFGKYHRKGHLKGSRLARFLSSVYTIFQ